MKNLLIMLVLLVLVSCRGQEQPNVTEMYFPPLQGSTWEGMSVADLGWDITKVAALEEILESGNTRGFILLKDGKIVLEKYFGSTLAGNQNFNQNSLWYWASAGKVLTASLTGIAQEEGFLNLQQPSSKHLGLGWTSLSKEQEDKILIWHQLTMTSGLDDAVSNRDDFSPSNLVFQAAPGTRWAYHNAPYTLLEQVISSATDRDFSSYFNEKIASKIGMSGSWQRIGFNQVYFSNARSMARFGLMILAEGKWANEEIIKDRAFFDQMIQSSQLINPAYGYLWWLNGKSNFMLPVVQTVFSGSLIPDAPGDMIVAAGRDGQFLCVVPSENLVLVRMGLDADQSLVSFIYLNRIWKALGDLRR